MDVIDRHIEPLIRDLLKSEPVVVVDGPRTAGKSFTVNQVTAGMSSVPAWDLDQPEDLENLRRDPRTVLAGPGLVVVDEFQRATADVLGAIKAHLNKDGVTPGRYLLTGSTRADLLSDLSDYLTGRHHRLTLLPYSQAEMEGTPGGFLERFMAQPGLITETPPSSETLEGYFLRVERGGFPLAVARGSSQSRRRWFRDYIEGVTARAAAERGLRGNGAGSLLAVLRGAASITAQLSNLTHIQEVCATERNGDPPDQETVRNWLAILEEVHIIHRLEAWGTNLRSRVTKSPKMHFIDSGLTAHLLRLTSTNMAHASKIAEAGHLLETFVVTELLKQRAVLGSPPEVGHFRTSDDQEVDLVMETENGLVYGFEVKRAVRLRGKDFSGLQFLADKLGKRFGGGVVLHGGRQALSTDIDGVYSAPISVLWS